MANSFDLSVNVRNANPSANIDFYYGTYNSVADALAGVPKAVRMKGKTVGVIVNGSVAEYWWKSGVEDADLVEKINGSVAPTYEFGDGLVKEGNEVSILIDPTSVRDAYNNDMITLSGNGLRFSGSVLTTSQVNGINWAIGKREEEMQEIANSLFEITTTATGGSLFDENGIIYYADEDSSVTMNVVVEVKFDNAYVTPTNESDVLESGWSKVELGKYTKSLTSADGSVGSQEFTYLIPEGTYAGITCAKSSKTKSIRASYPIYYGFYPTNDMNDLEDAVGTLTRSVTRYGVTDGVLANDLSEVAYYWVLTHNSATVTDKMTGNMVNLETSSAEFESTRNPNITMSDYKLYISKSSALGNGVLSSAATIDINV